MLFLTGIVSGNQKILKFKFKFNLKMAITIIGLKQQGLLRLINGFDSNGNICGKNNEQNGSFYGPNLTEFK